MDYGRRIGKESKSWSRLQSEEPVLLNPCSTKRRSKRHQQIDVEEDHRLVNWKRWIADRNRRQQHLAKALKREPLDLALNAHDRVRPLVETKRLLEAATKTEITNQDRYRGNPAFWHSPRDLKNENCDVDLVGIEEREKRFLPPDVPRVGLPDLIKKEKKLVEKHVDPAKINWNSKWECGDYLKRRTADLKRDIEFLEPKKPEIEDLIITGKNFDCGEKVYLLRTPVITVSEETRKRYLTDPNERIVLKIQDREFALEKGRQFERLSLEETQKLQESKEDQDERKYTYAIYEFDRVYQILPKKAKPITWTLNFETSRNEMRERKFILENKGVRTVTLDWRNVTPKAELFPISDRADSRFFFNKNQICILPGQKLEIPIWFRADHPLVASEMWSLLIEPKVYPGTLHLRLWATSSGEHWKVCIGEKYKSVKEQLRICVRDTTIRDTLDELLLAATTQHLDPKVPYEKFFTETDIFEARNPKYHFDSALVGELQAMYKEVVTEKDPEWSLSLQDLRSILIEVEDWDTKREMLKRFQQICRQCLIPQPFYKRPTFSKERTVYLLLCGFFNEFEDESAFVMCKCCLDEIPEVCDDEMVSVSKTGSKKRVKSGEAEDESVDSFVCRDFKLYNEVLYLRIYCLLNETINKICASIDTYNYYNKGNIN